MPSIEAEVTPAVIEWARETAGFSVDEAAVKLGVRPRRILEWEEGVRSPTMRQARDVAWLYRRPLALLFLPDPPHDPIAPPDFRGLAGTDAEAATPELRHQIRLAESRRATALELDPGRRAAIAALIGTISIDSSPATQAAMARRTLDVTWTDQLAWRDNYAALNAWRTALEALGVLVFRFSGVPAMTARGFSIPGEEYPVVSVNASDAPVGRVFTLLHEFGHLLVGTGGLCNLNDEDMPTAAVRSAERFCNAFAAATLMPESELLALPAIATASRRSEWGLAALQELATAIHVSRHAILIRLLEVGKTNEVAFQRSLADLQAAGAGAQSQGFELVPEGAVREIGAPYARLILAAYQNDKISARDLAEYLGVRFKHVPRIQELLETSPA